MAVGDAVIGGERGCHRSQLNEGTGRFLDLHQEMRRPFIPTERAALLAREGSEQLGSRNDVVGRGRRTAAQAAPERIGNFRISSAYSTKR